jgi:predicted metal-dependent phosphoesterase TrpH
MNWDLHCHSSASDGIFSPGEVVRRAHANGVTVLSLTDHDATSGLAEAEETAALLGLRFWPGVEISVSWEGQSLHVLGLGIDAANATLNAGLGGLRAGRWRRAVRIADALSRVGIAGSLEGAMSYAGNSELVSRTHFARFLAARNYARDVKSVFRRFLSVGKPGYVAHEWASLGDAARWIRASGGIAVLAHPARCKLSEREMRRLLCEFRGFGGEGVEVVTGNHARDQYERFARLARDLGLAASRGSDFHGPGESRADLGMLAEIPPGLTPVHALLEGERAGRGWHDPRGKALPHMSSFTV